MDGHASQFGMGSPCMQFQHLSQLRFSPWKASLSWTYPDLGILIQNNFLLFTNVVNHSKTEYPFLQWDGFPIMDSDELGACTIHTTTGIRIRGFVHYLLCTSAWWLIFHDHAWYNWFVTIQSWDIYGINVLDKNPGETNYEVGSTQLWSQ